ncbi:uncharacterized protein LOC125927220 isoform X2 [Panthera uncia]|uniref:uncharacterized protein LOC125927220 isoform X2 n=1 Tax=Panthera uncia TaxID=29064 RepID=UPI0020FF8F88|nr:uncharacterized protein LOC125927220 isoform X2 [Panthera uncia]
MAPGPQPPEPCATMWSSKSRGRSACGRDCPVTREPAPGLVETRDAVSGPPCASVGQVEGPGRGGGSAEPAVKSCIPVTALESAVPASQSLGQPVSRDREGQVGRNPIEFMRHQMHQLVDIFCDRTQHQSRGAQVGRRGPHSHALCSWGRVGGFTMTTMTVRVMEMLPRVCSLLTPGHLLAHSPRSHPRAGEGTGEKCRGPGRLRKVIKPLRILMTERGCQIPGPQAPGLDPVMGAWGAENRWGLGGEDCGRERLGGF